MNITARERTIVTIRQGDSNFHLNDGMVLYPRAMLHVLPECPASYRHTINDAMAKGYIKMVANVQGKELTWEKLTND